VATIIIIATLKRKIYEFVSTYILPHFKKVQNSLLGNQNWHFLFDSENLEVSPLAKMQKIGC